jgi:UDP-N-acetylglucosamine diphosphorylase / glucose-1-phosphate thymidylyltransferase / UDP-N-acetylgalactosamine diphosphorylase / glucosamine-1-phosphate N-acetyltransferase / galactosamine-1-phosphate N-acetyltransferase
MGSVVSSPNSATDRPEPSREKEFTMRICIFEDRPDQFEPLTLTRPVFEMRCGMTTLAHKQARALGGPVGGVLLRPTLAELYRLEHPNLAVNDADWLGEDAVILVNGRWLPPEDLLLPTMSSVGICGGAVVYVVLQKSAARPLEYEHLPQMLSEWQRTLPACAAGGRMLNYAWDVVDANAGEIRRDFAWLPPMREPVERPSLGVVGPLGNLWIAPSARIEPMVVIDTTQGPVVLDEGAVITAFTRLEGPCYVGPDTQIFAAKIRAGSSFGPQCRVGGEVEASIIHGYSNKYHDGFLGHSYVGEWVNLGAGTHNSDLRNDYGEVTMTLNGIAIPTGMNKVGCFLGDHTKTGLGVLFNTGTAVGAFCGLLPAGRFAPKALPSFTSWWNGSVCEAFTLEQLLATAEIAMQRRGVTLTVAHRTLYTALHEETAGERRRVLREREQRAFRKSA